MVFPQLQEINGQNISGQFSRMNWEIIAEHMNLNSPKEDLNFQLLKRYAVKNS